MKKLLSGSALMAVVIIGIFILGYYRGISDEKGRIKSADEISMMVDQTLAYHQKELDNLQSSTAAEKKKLSDAAKQILKKYLPEELQEKKQPEGGEK